MSPPDLIPAPSPQARKAVRRVLDAVDRVLAAADDLRSARNALAEQGQETPRLRVLPAPGEVPDAP
jgi:hypothetical protein